MDRVVIGHCDDSNDIEYLERLIESGVNIGFDRFGLQQPTTTLQRVEMLVRLLHKGYSTRIVLSHDASGFEDMARQESIEAAIPTWRFDYLSSAILPELRERHIPDEQIRHMTELNPRRILTPHGAEAGQAPPLGTDQRGRVEARGKHV